ncbi:hypothetical protein ACHAW6_005773, partial [Cyclotella cf. meneghiniana]
MKIDDQPTDENLNQLVRELTKATASILTTNGGGAHRHIGMIIPDAEYNAVDPDPVVRKCQVAEHKAELQEIKTYMAVKMALRKEIVKCIDEEWIEELKSETMGYMHRSPRKMLDHLYHTGGDLNHMDITEQNQELLK